MPRHPKLAPGPATLALCLGLALVSAPRPTAAQEPAKAHPAAPAAAKGSAAPHAPAASHAESKIEQIEESVREAEHEIAAHEVHGAPNPLEPQPNLAIFTVVVFLGLLFVLGRFAWRPLLQALHRREEHLEHVLLETERARNESEQLLAEHRAQMAAAQDQVRALIEEARRNAQQAADEIVRKAQGEADASRQRAERDIAAARDQALSEIWTKAADLAVSAAAKVLDRSLTEDDHRRLFDAAVGALPEVQATANGRGGAAR
jgi:F-type H+-transporting ATPase subunit b